MLEKKIRRYKLIEKHRELVKESKYILARLILRLLNTGTITLGMDMDSFNIRAICRMYGCEHNSDNIFSEIVYL